MNMLQCKNIRVSFGNHRVLNNFSCEVRVGDFIVIVGPNGAGKSTLFDMIAGKVRPSAGTIVLDNQDITHGSEQERASVITRIFQNTALNSVGSLTVAQNLALAQYSRRAVRLKDGMSGMPLARAEQLLAQVGLPATLLHKPMNRLSGGQRQLIAFVMATQQIPKLLLLDEPTAALDPQAATQLLVHATKFITAHAITTLLITHDPYIARTVGNKVWVLKDGAVVQQFQGNEKRHLDPQELIGHIDYEKLAALHNT
jgi:putative tryptophan/tyrosine transport system ATP-binding protein